MIKEHKFDRLIFYFYIIFIFQNIYRSLFLTISLFSESFAYRKSQPVPKEKFQAIIYIHFSLLFFILSGLIYTSSNIVLIYLLLKIFLFDYFVLYKSYKKRSKITTFRLNENIISRENKVRILLNYSTRLTLNYDMIENNILILTSLSPLLSKHESLICSDIIKKYYGFISEYNDHYKNHHFKLVRYKVRWSIDYKAQFFTACFISSLKDKYLYN